MPCMKCANGKWKYGEHGNCQFDTLSACKAAAAAIHIGDKAMNPTDQVDDPQVVDPTDPEDGENVQPMPSDWHDPMCQCSMCKSCKPM